MRNKFRNTIVYRNLFWSIWGYGKGRKGSMFVYIGGDSSPASAHGSPLKRTRTESVSTDLYALSRGFIPGGIVITSGMKTRFIIGYRNPAYKQVGIPIPQISLSVREAVSKRRNGFMSVYIGGESSPASAHGSPLKWTRLESVSTDLYALSRGFIPVELWQCRVWKPDLQASFLPLEGEDKGGGDSLNPYSSSRSLK